MDATARIGLAGQLKHAETTYNSTGNYILGRAKYSQNIFFRTRFLKLFLVPRKLWASKDDFGSFSMDIE